MMKKIAPAVSFKERVYQVVRSIKRGDTMTYRGVARLAGVSHAYRAVGTILNRNYNSRIPCHRVIRSDGTLGGYNRGMKRKRMLLQKEAAAGSRGGLNRVVT